MLSSRRDVGRQGTEDVFDGEDTKEARRALPPQRTVTPDTALRFARFTGTEPEFWLNLQQALDLWDAMHSDRAAELERIKPARVA